MLQFGECQEDDVPAATQAATTNVVGVMSSSDGVGLILTTSRRRQLRVDFYHCLGWLFDDS